MHLRRRATLAAATLLLALAACDEGPADPAAGASSPSAAASPASPSGGGAGEPSDDVAGDEAGGDEDGGDEDAGDRGRGAESGVADAGTPAPDDAGPRDVLQRTAGVQRATITVDGRARSYLAVVPTVVAEGVSAPVVLAFHGFGQDADAMLAMTGLARDADRDGHIVLVPDGIGRSFNGGGCCGPAVEQGVDDVALARALVAAAAVDLGADADRVVATGFSNGAWLSHRIACEASDLVVGVVPQSGALDTACTPSRPIDVVHLHGSSDLVVPQSRGRASVDRWADLLGCTASVVDDDGSDGQEGVEWSGCDDDVEVAFGLRRGAGHEWLRGAPLATNDVVAAMLARH